MLVAVGSTNPVKVEATRQAFIQFFDTVDMIPVNVPSGVKPFPTSESETLQGAINRAHNTADKIPEAECAVGIESGIVEMDGKKFVRTYAAILHEGVLVLGGSAAYEAPEPILSRIEPSTDASKRVIDSMMGRKDVLDKEGVVGVLTQGRLARSSILCDAVICALSRFVSPRYYGEAKP